MIVITGPSASGKTATCLYLQQHYGIRKVITHTTRPMRDGEKDGVDYHFVSEEEFVRMIDNDEFVENVIFNGYRYGTSKKEVGIDKCMAVELEGAKTYRSFNDKNIVLFYMVLDEETCKERMLQRGDKPDRVLSRILNDRKAFRLNAEMKTLIDVIVDTKTHNLESVSQFIYEKYIKILNERGIAFKKSI